MKRDSKGRFRPKGLIIPIPSASMTMNIIILIFLFLPWIYVGLKFSFVEKIFELLSSIFSNCECSNNLNEGTNKY